MPFPFKVGLVQFPHAVGLGYVVMADCRAGGGTLIEGEGPEAWLVTAVRSGDLSDEEIHGLVRALLERTDALSLGLGASLTRSLGLGRVGDWVIRALEGADLGALLALDPFTGQTVEAVLSRAAAEAMELTDPVARGLVLAGLRSVGASVEEARVLGRFGSIDEILRWGPGLLAEQRPEIVAALEVGRSRASAGEAIEDLLDPW